MARSISVPYVPRSFSPTEPSLSNLPKRFKENFALLQTRSKPEMPPWGPTETFDNLSTYRFRSSGQHDGGVWSGVLECRNSDAMSQRAHRETLDGSENAGAGFADVDNGKSRARAADIGDGPCTRRPINDPKKIIVPNSLELAES